MPTAASNAIISPRARLSGRAISGVALAVAAFAALQITYSLSYGRLAFPPTYDDVSYIADGLDLLRTGYGGSIRTWFTTPFTNVWHAPIAALQACLALAVSDRALWAVYASNALYAFGLALAVVAVCLSAGRVYTIAMMAAVLAWPVSAYLITEFRPDIVANYLLAVGGWLILTARAGDRRTFVVLGALLVAALWVKPSYSPVTLGYWAGAIAIRIAFRTSLDGNGSTRAIARALAAVTGIALVAFLPYLVVSGGHLIDYLSRHVAGPDRALWTPSMTLSANLLYYVNGDGAITLGAWLWITAATAACAGLLAWRRGDVGALTLGAAYGLLAVLSWLGLTLLGNKSAWFGTLFTAHLQLLFVATSTWIARAVRGKPPYWVLVVALAASAVGLQQWPVADGATPRLGPPGIARASAEARRLFAEVCQVLPDDGSPSKVDALLVPLVSATVNPGTLRMCALDGKALPQIPALYPMQVDALMTQLGAYAALPHVQLRAFVLSADFPGVVPNMPGARAAATINRFFATSPAFELSGEISGPEHTGRVLVYKTRATTAEPVPAPQRAATGSRHAPDTLPNFDVDLAAGFGPLEGPFRELGLGAVTWGTGTQSTIAVAPSDRPRTLEIDWRPQPDVAGLDVKATGRTLGHCPRDQAPGIFSTCRLPLPADAGTTIHIAYVSATPTAPSANRVLYRALRAVSGDPSHAPAQ
ncbi:MAG: hypothetical protein JSR18_05520 [Proteobacteria bacterium]|nr:hypothetical protein [Pseudomonadota bacterium]